MVLESAHPRPTHVEATTEECSVQPRWPQGRAVVSGPMTHLYAPAHRVARASGTSPLVAALRSAAGPSKSVIPPSTRGFSNGLAQVLCRPHGACPRGAMVGSYREWLAQIPPSPPPARGRAAGRGEGGGWSPRSSCRSSPHRDKLGGGENVSWQGVQIRYCTLYTRVRVISYGAEVRGWASQKRSQEPSVEAR